MVTNDTPRQRARLSPRPMQSLTRSLLVASFRQTPIRPRLQHAPTTTPRRMDMHDGTAVRVTLYIQQQQDAKCTHTHAQRRMQKACMRPATSADKKHGGTLPIYAGPLPKDPPHA
jgi:hypothetical protein